MYYLETYGREMAPGFSTLAEARKRLVELAGEELTRAKRRYPKARLHRFADSARVTIGASYHSTLWSAHSIVKA